MEPDETEELDATLEARELEATDELEDLDELDTKTELDDLDELDTTAELDELEITTELDDLDELDTNAELDATLELELNELDFTLELINELVELLDFALDIELTTELLTKLDDRLDLTLELELATGVLLDEFDFMALLRELDAKLLDMTDAAALLNDEFAVDELDVGIGLGPVSAVLDELNELEVATEEGAKLLLTALTFASELRAPDELVVFEDADEFATVLDELTAVELTVGLLLFFPPPPPPPPHAVSETTVIKAPKSTTFLFADMQAPELIIEIPELMLSI